MATQRITVAKIIGKAATTAVELFRRWSAARLTDDVGEWSHEQWPEAIRKKADAWAAGLRAHAHEPPVVFFAEYIDAWSMCPMDFHFGLNNPGAGLIRIYSDCGELYCLPLPIKKKVRRYLKRLRKNGQWFEDRLFGKIVFDALNAWDKLVEGGAIVFLRNAYAPSVSDEEIEASTEVVPAWMTGERAEPAPTTIKAHMMTFTIPATPDP